MNKPLLLLAISGWMIMFCIRITIAQTGSPVYFPLITGPIQITDSSKEHLLASYYGINSFNASQTYVTVLQTDIKYRLPTERDPATLGLVDLKTHEFIPLTQTKAWNFQQGCMAHWLGSSPDSLIIFNDLRNGKFVSVIMNVHTRKELKILPYPVSAVAPNGKEAISINFARLRITREDYGYGGEGQDKQEGVRFPDNDGLFRINLETGEAKLIVSIKEVKDLVPELPEEGIEYFNHTLYSRDGSKVFWLARAIPQRNTTAFTVNADGTDLQRCFPDNWGGSHFDWLSGDELMVTAAYEGEQYGHILFTVGETNFKRLGRGLLDYDGHGTFSPDKKWMITDTYPSKNREQKIYLMDMETESIYSIGRFFQPKAYTKAWRCDIHCRWSPKGDWVGFNSTHSGSRQVYLLKIEE
ncbi:MAG: hypothetical protein AAF694_21300 [Bacteroidota bacterium]